MRLKHLVVTGIVGVCLFWFFTSYEPFYPPKVILGDKNIGVVEFPKEWTKGQLALLWLMAMDSYEIRKTSNEPTKELLFSMRSHEDGSYSNDSYRVSLDGRFHVESCSKEEWINAVALTRSQRQIVYSDHDFNTNPTIELRGRKFQKSGQYWGVALSSPSENWLALVSYSSRVKPRKDGFILSTKQPTRGRIFLEIYETSSGVKSLAAEASYKGLGPATLYGDAFWAGERYFVLPLDHLAKTCFLAIVPEH